MKNQNITIQIILCFFFLNTYGLFAQKTVSPDTIQEVIEVEFASLDEDESVEYFDSDSSSSIVIRLGMLDMGISTYVDEDKNIDLPDELDFMDQVLWRSINVGWQVVNIMMDFSQYQTNSKFSLSTGLKLNWNHYSLEKDYNLIRNQPTYEAAIDYDVPELKKNRLRATYLQVPIMLEFNSNPTHSGKSIKLGIGYVHQFLLGSQYKYKTTDGVKLKTRGDFNLRKSMGMIEARVGIGPLNFYMQYGLNYLFQDNNGPELTPINFGINIIPR